jgi:pullulanase/glycogen debranching enzyme
MTTAAPAIRIWESNSTQLGAKWDGLGVNFSLFSANATKVELCLFDQDGTRKSSELNCPNTPTKSGMDICPTRDQERYTRTACTAPIISHRLEEK